MDHRWFRMLEEDLHAADVAVQRRRMLELLEAGYDMLRRQYAGRERELQELEHVHAWLKSRIAGYQDE